jgi:hypothetical protein
MTASPNFASEAAAEAEGSAPGASAGPFVLNLCSSTTPMALAQIELPELKRFNFFVSRRFEEGRERFRLHMGYFATLAEAEEWLAVVREIYPGAWAGEAPGRKLRERAAAAAAAQAANAAGPRNAAPAAVARATAAPVPENIPVVHAAPPVATPAAPAAIARPAPARAAAAATPRPASPAAAPAARAAAPATPVAAPPRTAPAAPAAARAPVQPAPPAPPAKAPIAPAVRPSAPAATAARPAPQPPRAALPVAPPVKSAPAPQARPAAAVVAKAPAPPGAKVPAATPVKAAATPVKAAAAPVKAAAASVKPVFEDSNVREVLKALGDASATGETRLMKAPPMPREAVAPANSSLSDTQVLKMLETRRSEGSEPAATEIDDSGIPLLKPDDTGTRQALKEAVSNNAAVSFAVQLQWSVWPVELDKMPPLAIFSAYTLYTVEGSRDGRKWYGVRLGFFSDAISAKQVAYYVRSEFASVAVVPVSPEEKTRATEQEIAATLATPVPTRSDPMDEFKLIDDVPAIPKPATPPPQPAAAGLKPPPGKPIPKVAVGRTVAQPQAQAPTPPAASAPTRRTRAKTAGTGRKGQASLEETLEILGAGQLQIDDGTGETLNDSGVRHLRVEVQRNSPFSKLLERLSERMKKP